MSIKPFNYYNYLLLHCCLCFCYDVYNNIPYMVNCIHMLSKGNTNSLIWENKKLKSKTDTWPKALDMSCRILIIPVRRWQQQVVCCFNRCHIGSYYFHDSSHHKKQKICKIKNQCRPTIFVKLMMKIKSWWKQNSYSLKKIWSKN